MAAPPPISKTTTTGFARVHVRFNANQLDKDVRRVTRTALEAMAGFGVRQAKILASEGYPPASKPGEPPHVRTSNLLAHIDMETIDDFNVRYGVEFGLVYGLWLEEGTPHGQMAPRPFLTPTILMIRAKFAQFFRGAF